MKNNLDTGQTIKPRVRLVSFGAGPRSLEKPLRRLKRQADLFPWIDESYMRSSQDLPKEFFDLLGPLLEEEHKGFGLWSWKPFLIEQEFSQLREGDVLIYTDAGVEINRKGASRFTFYLDHLAQADVLVFSLDHQHRQWTKDSPKIFDLGEHYFRNQVVAGILLFRVSEKSKELISKWKKLCLEDGGALLRDPYKNSPEFHSELVEHRHDQSLLSRAVFDLKIQTIPDETFFRPWSKGYNYPFLALRNRSSSFSWLWWALRTPFIVWMLAYVSGNPLLIRKSLRKLAERIKSKGTD